MTSTRTDSIRYLADENATGLAKVLIRKHAISEVTHIGHPDLPQVSRGTPDLEWLAYAGTVRLVNWSQAE